MSDYDNTNSGIIFQPHDDQEFRGQGRINIEGRDSRCVLIREKLSRDGDPVLVMYQRAAVFFPNDKGDNEKRPDFSGPLDNHPDMRCAVWVGEKDGRKNLQIKVDYKNQDGAAAPATAAAAPVQQMANDIPF